jgi:hypothetical protein
MYRLLAYILNGTSVNNTNYSIDDLNGNKPYILSNTPINNYLDITSIENWHKYGDQVLRDY